jgi:acetyl-CoA C-acetyltransferase/acetyl-CoA acyltransferase
MMRQVAVVGVGMTPFGRSDKDHLEMFGEAAMDAVNESSLRPRDIEALFLGNAVGDLSEGQTVMASHAAAEIGILGIPATRVEGACAAGTMAIISATMAIASGHFDIVLAAGTERQTVSGTAFATRIMNTGPHHLYEGPTGLTFPGIFAMMAHFYAKKYEVPLERLKDAMARVAIKNHRNGERNPKCQFPSIADMMERRKSKAKKDGRPVPTWSDEMGFLRDSEVNVMIAEPLQLFDCCPISDGAAAVVLVPVELARRLTDKPVTIAGFGQAAAGGIITQRDFARLIARETSAKQAYDMAGLTPNDIDVCELHDCFTIAEIVAMEGLGFFDFGEGYKAVERGETEMGGKIPINPSGGLKAKGHPVGATGVAQVYEIVNQLRGICGERQVEGAQIGMTDTMGGTFASVGNIILKRGW